MQGKYYENGKIEKLSKNPYNKITVNKSGFLHSIDDQPGYISYDDNYKLKTKEYYQDGRLHRRNGKPSVIVYLADGSISEEKYYLKGIEYSREDYREKLGLNKVKVKLEPIIEEIPVIDEKREIIKPKDNPQELLTIKDVILSKSMLINLGILTVGLLGMIYFIFFYN